MKKYLQFINEGLGEDENIWRQAFALNDTDELQKLIDKNPNYIDYIAIDLGTQSPTLVEACRNHPDSMIEFLVENGADVNKCTNRNLSPLFWAARNRNIKIVKLLLSKGANPNNITKSGSSILGSVAENSFAVSENREGVVEECMEIIRMLLKAGANPYYIDPIKDNDGDFWSVSSHFLKRKIAEEYPEILKQLRINKKGKRFDL